MAEQETINPKVVLMGVDALLDDIAAWRKEVEKDTQGKAMPTWMIRLQRNLNQVKLVAKDSGSIDGPKMATVSPRMGRKRGVKPQQRAKTGEVTLADLFAFNVQQLRSLNKTHNVPVDTSLPDNEQRMSLIEGISGKLNFGKEFETAQYLREKSQRRVNEIAQALKVEFPEDARNKTERSVFLAGKTTLAKVKKADEELTPA